MFLRILICRSNGLDPDPRVEKIARALADAGHKINILGWDKTGMLPEHEVLDGISIERLSIKARFGRGMANLGHELRWQFGLLRWLIKHHPKFDVIHACDFDTVLPSMFCKKIWGTAVVYDIFDFYADMLRATPDPIVQWIRKADLRVIEKVDAVVLADDSRTEQISGAHPKRLAVIYNSPEYLAVSPDPRPERSQLHIAYVGLLQKERGLFELLAILRKHPEWTLALAGFGGEEEELHQIAIELPNVTWHGRVPYERALQINAAADVLIATYDPAIPNHRYSSPNKAFEAMLLGKPIIVANNTNVDILVESTNSGVAVDYGNSEAIEAALEKFQNAPELLARLGNNAYQAYQTTYAWRHMAKRLAILYAEI